MPFPVRRVVLGLLGLCAAGFAGYRAYQWATTRKPDFADLAYGSGPRQMLDIYLPAGDGPFPFVIDIHGGAFKVGSKSMSNPSQTLLDAGIAIIRPNYRFSSTDIWPAQGQDCLAATDFVIANAATYRLDPARFALWGQSAGGFLAVSTALSLVERGQPPRAVVNFFGPMDFSTMDADMAALGRTAAMGTANAADSAESLLIGFAVGDDPARAKSIGPIGRLEGMAPRALPPLYARHGDADTLIAHGQAERLAAVWAQVDPATTVDLAILPGAGHGGDVFDGDSVMVPLRDFLQTAFGA